MYRFKRYNVAKIMSKEIKVNDAVKVTSYPQMESFWVQVEEVNRGERGLIGSVQNNLVREHGYKAGDIISFDKRNIKEHKAEADRFKLDSISDEDIAIMILGAIAGLNVEEFDTVGWNVRNI